MRPDPQIRVVVLAQRIARLHVVFTKCVQELTGVVSDLASAGSKSGQIANILGSQAEDPAALFHRPIVDASARTVTWQGRSCTLGSNRLLSLMERLARRPNIYLPIDRLIRDVWAGKPVTDDTVRSTVRSLKHRLRQDKMPKLARSIRCAQRQYGLILEDVE